jgi:isocitrate dehydrogenase kinase/phosphatase
MLVEAHPELFDYRYWRARQQDIRNGIQGNVFPYSKRICFPRPVADPQAAAQAS